MHDQPVFEIFFFLLSKKEKMFDSEVFFQKKIRNISLLVPPSMTMIRQLDEYDGVPNENRAMNSLNQKIASETDSIMDVMRKSISNCFPTVQVSSSTNIFSFYRIKTAQKHFYSFRYDVDFAFFYSTSCFPSFFIRNLQWFLFFFLVFKDGFS